jgi:Holliday junction resolvase RusA-like endonuclease
MDTVSFTLEGPPRAWQAPRVTRRCAFSPNHKEKEADHWEIVSQIKAKGYLFLPIKEAVTIYAYFSMPIPKSFTKKKVSLILDDRLHHTSKPDLDNCIKYLLDVLKRTVIEDDNQVCGIFATKQYSQKPKTFVKINRVENSNAVDEGEI